MPRFFLALLAGSILFGAEASGEQTVLSVFRPGSISLKGEDRDWRTPVMRLPEAHGKIGLKAVLRTSGGESCVSVHLVADSWNWRRTTEVSVTPMPQTVCLDGEIPLEIKKDSTFFAMIVIPPGGEIICDRLEILWEQLDPTESRPGVELFRNADFLGGAWGYMRWYPASRPELAQETNVRVSGGIANPARASFRTFSVALKPETDYTLAIRARNADPAKRAIVSICAVDGEWHAPHHRQALKEGDDWQVVRFPFRTVRSLYCRWYLMVGTDAQGGEIELDRVSLAEGVVEEFPPLPDGELVPGSTTMFTSGRGGVFRVIRRNVTGESGAVNLSVWDAWGRMRSVRALNYGTNAFATCEFEIPADHPRGVFEVGASEGHRVRYCVAEDLSGLACTYNPHAGHIYPHAPKDLSWQNRFMPITGSANRSFCGSMELVRSQEYLDRIDALGTGTILVMPNYPTFSAVGHCPWTEEVKKGYLPQCVEVARRFAGHRVMGVELFNEPFLWRIREGADAGLPTMDAAKVARIHAEVVPLMKAENPELQIVGPCCALKEQRYFDEFVRAGGGKFIDAVSIHSYTPDPDMDDFAGLYRQLRKRIREGIGNDLPVYNTEAYFGVRNGPCTGSDNEAQRGYYRDSELSHASVSAAMLANHAAEQASWCNFGPDYYVSGILESDRPYPFVALPAVNAAISFLADSGPGQEIDLAPGLRCFLFERAKGGPLATIRNRISTPVAIGGLGGLRTFDLFGNPFSDNQVTLSDDMVYVRFVSASDARARLKALTFTGLEAVAARERPLKVATVGATYSKELSFTGVERVKLGKANLSMVHDPDVEWKGEKDLSAEFAVVWNESALRLRIAVRDDVALYPDSLPVSFVADSLQVYFDQHNDATPASEESGRNRDDDIVYNIASLDGKKASAYVSFANGSRYLGPANETTGFDSEVTVSYERRGNVHLYDMTFPACVFPDMKLTAGLRCGFSIAVHDADAPKKRGRSIVLSSPGEEPYNHAHEYLDLELKGLP